MKLGSVRASLEEQPVKFHRRVVGAGQILAFGHSSFTSIVYISRALNF
jgi:hypothetical protein